ncbi:uncharacterized protein [Physcomitrium patens]|uniref:uncharacterized protein isoform X3 n=1 Tax=Physcomitrium patens TaxID=3218 RepID=UPI003CCD8CF2
MSDRRKVNLSFNHTSKRSGSTRTSFADARDFVWDSSSVKKKKDGMGAAADLAPSDIQPDAFSWGLVGHSDPFLGYDAAGIWGTIAKGEDQSIAGYRRQSAVKNSKGAALARKVRGLSASPKAVSSLESCLRAQMADLFVPNRVKVISRPPNFPSPAVAKAKSETLKPVDIPASPSRDINVIDENSSSSRRSGLLKLPNLSKFLKEYASKLALTSKDESITNNVTGNKGVSENDMASNSSNGSSCSAVVSFDTLVFIFGVALGVLIVSGSHRTEVNMLRKLLEEAQASVEGLKLELAKREGAVRNDRFDSASVSDIEQEDQMADLEAELEAELDQLTGRDSATMDSQYSAFDELDTDGVVSVVHGDLAPTGLPARVEESSDEDLSPPAQPACLNNYAVSPRELTRLLHKLQKARQDDLISELEEDLEAALSKLQSRDKELEVLKERLRRLTEVSCTSASVAGDECLTPCTPQKGETSADRSSTTREEVKGVSAVPGEGSSSGGVDSSHLPVQEGDLPAIVLLSEEIPTGFHSHPSLGSGRQGVLKSSLHMETTKQESDVTGRESSKGWGISGESNEQDNNAFDVLLQPVIEFEDEGRSQAEVAARDCKLILDNAQIITQLIDSVHGLESYGDQAESVELGSATPSFGLLSSSVSISDAVDHPVESATPEPFKGRGIGGALFSQAKLGVPHPSRRTSCNSDVNNPVLNRKLDSEKPPFPNPDNCTANVRYTEAMESSKSVSDISEAETLDHKTPYSVKYIDLTTRPASEPVVPADDNPPFWVGVGVGRAGLTTPVEKVRQKLFMSHQSAPVQWPGELSPTVLEKIARWEGLMEGETPGPAAGSDWECQSRVSECDDFNVFSEENLVLEAEEMLGRMLIKRFVEKAKCGSDVLVKKAQSALATLERRDSMEGDSCNGEDACMNEKTGSEASFSERGRSDVQEKQPTSFLGDTVREEYEFFRRLEILSKDRKSTKIVKEAASIETAVAVGMHSDVDPRSNSGMSAQVSTGGQHSRIVDVSTEQKPDSLVKEKHEKQMFARNGDRGSASWLSRDAGQVARRRGGQREDEVRSRRRL